MNIAKIDQRLNPIEDTIEKIPAFLLKLKLSDMQGRLSALMSEVNLIPRPEDSLNQDDIDLAIRKASNHIGLAWSSITNAKLLNEVKK